MYHNKKTRISEHSCSAPSDTNSEDRVPPHAQSGGRPSLTARLALQAFRLSERPLELTHLMTILSVFEVRLYLYLLRSREKIARECDGLPGVPCTRALGAFRVCPLFL